MSDIGTDETASDDLASLLQRREHARPTRLTYLLLALVVLAVGFVGGAVTFQRFGPSAASGTAFPMGPPTGMTAGQAAGQGLPGQALPGQGAMAGITAGTVALVDGRHLYVTDTGGETVKITVPRAATVTAQEDVRLADLAIGTSVIVRGAAEGDGTITASSVAEGGLPGTPPDPTALTPTSPAAPTTGGN